MVFQNCLLEGITVCIPHKCPLFFGWRLNHQTVDAACFRYTCACSFSPIPNVDARIRKLRPDCHWVSADMAHGWQGIQINSTSETFGCNQTTLCFNSLPWKMTHESRWFPVFEHGPPLLPWQLTRGQCYAKWGATILRPASCAFGSGGGTRCFHDGHASGLANRYGYPVSTNQSILQIPVNEPWKLPHLWWIFAM